MSLLTINKNGNLISTIRTSKTEPPVQQQTVPQAPITPMAQQPVMVQQPAVTHNTVVDHYAETNKNNEARNNTNKILVKANGKLHHANKLLQKLNSNRSGNPATDKKFILVVCNEVKDMISKLGTIPEDTAKFAKKLLDEADSIIKAAETVKVVASAQAPQQPPVQQQTAPQTPVIPMAQQPVMVQQPAVAHNTGYGFNIGNFIKPHQQLIIPPTANNQQQSIPTAFPHQICGLSDDQIVDEVRKHFKLIQPLGAYPLYDLLNNKLLANKMEELDCKQRANNPYLTQVDINKYIDIPELLAQYTLCFTMPCNNKKQLIVVLFNPNPEISKNGLLQYPIHIFKANKTAGGNNNNDASK